MTKDIWIKINSYIKNDTRYEVYEKHSNKLIKRLKLFILLDNSKELIEFRYTEELIIGYISFGNTDMNVVEAVKSYTKYLRLNDIIVMYDLYNKKSELITNISDIYGN